MSMQSDRLAYRDAIGGLTESIGGARREREEAEPEARAGGAPARAGARGGSSRATAVDREVEKLLAAHRRYVQEEPDDRDPGDPVDAEVRKLEEAYAATVRRTP